MIGIVFIMFTARTLFITLAKMICWSLTLIIQSVKNDDMQASHNPDKGAAKKAAVDSVLSQDIVKKCPSRDEWLTDLWIWCSILIFCSIDEVFVKFEGILIVVDAGINPLGVTYIDKKFLDLGGMPLIREGNHLWNKNLSLMTDYRLLEPKQTLILSEILMRIVWIHLFGASFSFSNHSNGLEAQPKCPANSLSPSRQWDSG